MSAIITTFIRSSTLLHETLAFIMVLALLAPFGSFVLATLLLLVAFLLRLMLSLRIMLRRTINRNQLQRIRLGRVDELMLRPSGNDDDVRGGDVLQQP